MVGGLYADEGHAAGEGSIALAKALGLNPFSKDHPPKVEGFEGRRFLYIVFPGAVVAPPWAAAVVARTALAGFGGLGRRGTPARPLPPLPAAEAGAALRFRRGGRILSEGRSAAGRGPVRGV